MPTGEVRVAVRPYVVSPAGDFVDALVQRRVGQRPLLILGEAFLERLALLEDLHAAGALARPGDLGACGLCGCTDELACPGGCSWVAPDLCSKCLPVAYGAARAALAASQPAGGHQVPP